MLPKKHVRFVFYRLLNNSMNSCFHWFFWQIGSIGNAYKYGVPTRKIQKALNINVYY